MGYRAAQLPQKYKRRRTRSGRLACCRPYFTRSMAGKIWGGIATVVVDAHEFVFFVKGQLRRARILACRMHQNMAKKEGLSILFPPRRVVRKSHLYFLGNELSEESGLFGVSCKDCGTLWKGCIKETYIPNSRARQGVIILSYFQSYLYLQILNISCCSVKLLSLNN